jgi:hypothetical protein
MLVKSPTFAVEQQWNRGALRSSRLSAVFALLAAFWAVQDTAFGEGRVVQ